MFMRKYIQLINRPYSIAPLVVFRLVFGLMMFGAVIRFWSRGWIHEFYIAPEFHFTYYGFDWIQPLGDPGMYILYSVIGITALGIALGAFYRLSAILFFLSFTYSELIDKTYYLNHYYFVSIIGFLLIFLPANRRFAIDTWIKPQIRRTHVPFWTIGVIMLQLGLVYFYAGVAKINTDWLLEAQPLKVWLKPKFDTPIIGDLLRHNWVHFFFAWFGMIYDCTVPFFLLNSKTRTIAYGFVIAFHVLTAMLFPIGIFPYVMILSTLIFFSPEFHERILTRMESLFNTKSKAAVTGKFSFYSKFKPFIHAFLILHFVLQIVIPWRYLLYPGDLFWTEEGFRFSWRVMLMEKYGTANFYVKDSRYPGYVPIDNKQYLNDSQIKQMSYQPDMLIQYAHFLHDKLAGTTMITYGDTVKLQNPEIRADVFVTLNGRPNQKYVSKEKVILSDQPYNLKHRTWLEPYKP